MTLLPVRTEGLISENEIAKFIREEGGVAVVGGTGITIENGVAQDITFNGQCAYETAVVRNRRENITPTTGVLELDLLNANHFSASTAANITSVVFQNVDAVRAAVVVLVLRATAAGLTLTPGPGYLVPRGVSPIPLPGVGLKSIFSFTKLDDSWLVGYKRGFA